MNPDIKTQWLSALRSGEYQQTRGALHRTEEFAGEPPAGYCCLGVLCDLAAKAGVVEEFAPQQDTLAGYRTKGRVELFVLPAEVQEWAGLGSMQGLQVGDGSLPSFNDSGKTFAEIADLIEEHA